MPQLDYDLLIVGGGINGAGIARDAAGRGLSVLLVEQDDLAQHTSSASTKLIHGGLRYLEYFEFGLVRAALRERERLLGLAPHLVRPLEFVLPQSQGPRPNWMIKLGLALYDRLGGRTRLPRSASIRIADSRFRFGLQPHVERGFSYADCWVDDSRLVILNALDAAERGAEIRTRTRFIEATRDTHCWRCTLLDTSSHESTTVSARVVINAAGPWVSEVLAHRVSVQRRKAVRLVKGGHIVVPRLYEGEHAFMLQNPDRRVVFVIPYEGRYSLIGTTEIPIDTPSASSPAITTEEVQYLCDTANQYFSRAIAAHDVVWSFSGTRPLFEDASQDASAVTRDYVLDIDASHGLAPILSVFGGKITTYRKLAENVLGKLAAHLRTRSAWTANAPLPGGDFEQPDVQALASSLQRRFAFVSTAFAQRLSRAYGTRALRILEHAKQLDDLGMHFGADLYQAEVDYLIDQEWARTADDILLRRSKLVLHMSAAETARLHEYLSDQSIGASQSARAYGSELA
jgi:glycerol-3-phosphate dehydrogenase